MCCSSTVDSYQENSECVGLSGTLEKNLSGRLSYSVNSMRACWLHGGDICFLNRFWRWRTEGGKGLLPAVQTDNGTSASSLQRQEV